MKQTGLDITMIEGKFAVAQVVLYVFSVLQVVVALATATGGMPLGTAGEVTTLHRIQVLIFSLAIAGAISVWKGRGVAREHASAG